MNLLLNVNYLFCAEHYVICSFFEVGRVQNTNFASCTCWFATSYRLPCSHLLFVVDKVKGALPNYPRWAVYSDETENPVELTNSTAALSVSVAVGLKNREKSVRTVIGEMSLLLASISTTVQGFPLPVMQGCINLLRTLHNRWKANEPTDLIDGGRILTMFSQDSAEVFAVSAAPDTGIHMLKNYSKPILPI